MKFVLIITYFFLPTDNASGVITVTQLQFNTRAACERAVDDMSKASLKASTLRAKMGIMRSNSPEMDIGVCMER